MSSSSEQDGSENEDKPSHCESGNSLHFPSNDPNADPPVYNDPQFILLDMSEHETSHSTTLQQPCFFTHLPNGKPPLTNSLPLPYQHHPTTLFLPHFHPKSQLHIISEHHQTKEEEQQQQQQDMNVLKRM